MCDVAVNNWCFNYYSGAQTWFSAQRICRLRHHGHLASDRSGIASTLASHGGSAWIALTRRLFRNNDLMNFGTDEFDYSSMFFARFLYRFLLFYNTRSVAFVVGSWSAVYTDSGGDEYACHCRKVQYNKS